MKVVFVQNLSGTALAGDIKEVKDGFARNFLVPKEIAFPATEKIIAATEDLRKKSGEFRTERKKQSLSAKDAISGKTLEFIGKADGDTLYAAITEANIIEKIKSELGSEIDKKAIRNGHLKTTGIHQVEAILSDGIIISFSVKITTAK